MRRIQQMYSNKSLRKHLQEDKQLHSFKNCAITINCENPGHSLGSLHKHLPGSGIDLHLRSIVLLDAGQVVENNGINRIAIPPAFIHDSLNFGNLLRGWRIVVCGFLVCGHLSWLFLRTEKKKAEKKELAKGQTTTKIEWPRLYNTAGMIIRYLPRTKRMVSGF